MIQNKEIPSNLSQLIQKISKNESFVRTFEIFQNKYKIYGTKVDSLTSQKVLQTYLTIKKKFYYQRKCLSNCDWFQNQLKIFIWILLCYLHIHNKEISMMTSTDWQYFKPIFYGRDPIIFEFQGIQLLKDKTSKWEEEEIKILEKIVNIKTLKNKWNSVARQLYILSEKRFIKTPKQCRERWLNYLDPSKVHSPWTFEEDLILLTSIQANGKKWAEIVRRLLKERTEHMVKNRFNSLINNQKKKIGSKSQSNLLNSAIETAKQFNLNKLSCQQEQALGLQELNKTDKKGIDFEYILTSKKLNGWLQQKPKKMPTLKSKQQISVLAEISSIPVQLSIQKQIKISVQTNNKILQNENSLLLHFQENSPIIGFNPFEEHFPKKSPVFPSFQFQSDYNLNCFQNQKIEMQQFWGRI